MTGSLLAMPMLILNMGGEMLYVLDQRLHAQKISEDKATRVMVDVVRTMFSPKFIAELFKEQEMYSVQSTRKIFDRLAHSSIMRLNTNSMDKLFDLMTMGLKRQMVATATPMELLDVTLNHLETVEALVPAGEVRDLVRVAIARAHETYAPLSVGQWYLLKQTLCRFFQNRRVKVSLFLAGETQRTNGVLVVPYWGPVPKGFGPPGTITHFGSDGAVLSTQRVAVACGGGERGFSPHDPTAPRTDLGNNIYTKNATGAAKPPAAAAARDAAAAASMGADVGAAKGPASGAAAAEKEAPSGAAAEMNLLADLLGAAAGASELKPFKLNLFSQEDDPIVGGTGGATTRRAEVVSVDAASEWKQAQREMRAKFDDEHGGDVGEAKGGDANDDDDDLLALMDEASGM